MKLAGRRLLNLLPALLLGALPLQAQSAGAAGIALPTFTRSVTVGGRAYNYTLLGGDPANGGTTTIQTVLVPITLTIEVPMNEAGKKAVLDAGAVTPRVLHSPIFAKYPFASGATQYADAMMRTDFYGESGISTWHTLLGKPEVVPLKISIPPGHGYVMTSRKTGRMLAMVDEVYVQKQIFSMLPKSAMDPNKLVIAVTRDATYYVMQDATLCCSWGTHGVDTSAGGRQPFVLGTYLDPNTVKEDSDIQPLTQQLAQFFRDPLHDPLAHVGRGAIAPGNAVPGWMKVPAPSTTEVPRQNSGCGGTAIATAYFLNDPTDINWKNTTPEAKPYLATAAGATYHLQNVALLQWFNQEASPTSYHGAYSFPDAKLFTAAATPCPMRGRPGGGGGSFGAASAAPPTTVPPVAMTGGPNGHQLIGYWSGLGTIRDISPQWDVIIVAFATPERNAPEGTMQYRVRGSMTEQQFIDDIKYKQSQGKKVMISLGGGGLFFTLDSQTGKENFIRTVEQICEHYGFDGVDIDFETPSIDAEDGDLDFQHPTTPGIVNLISALRTIHDHFGSKFMISLVPEGQQTSAGYADFGGQFGTYITLAEGLRDILSFIDTQDYNCPPIQGLDGEYYMPGSVNYHAAAMELLMHGFDVGRDPKHHFKGLPPGKVAVGFLNSDTTPEIVSDAMRFIITGKSKTPVTYKFQKPGGYPGFDGAMFWTIDADRRENYRYSNVVGPLLHSYPPAKAASK